MSDPYLERYKKAWEKTKGEVTGQGRRWSHLTCPEQFEKTCRLCTLAREILYNKNDYSPDMFEYARTLAQKKKIYMNVVLKKDPKKVVVLECGPKILGQLMDVQLEVPPADEKNFFFLKKGRNIIVKKVKQENGLPTYNVRFKQASAFNPEIIKQAHNLEDMERLVAENKVPVMRAVELDWGPNEMRILPNWRYGEKIELFFYSIKYHSGLTKSEFDSVQKGEYDPFSNALVPDEAESDVDPSGSFGESDVPDFVDGFSEEPTEDKDSAGDETWDDAVEKGRTESVDNESEQTEDSGDGAFSRPSCFGNPADYDADDEECTACPDSKDCGEAVKSTAK